VLQDGDAPRSPRRRRGGFALVARATAASPGPDRFEYEARPVGCPTGLRLVALRTGNWQRASVVASHGAGELDEPAGKAGLALLAARLSTRALGRGGVTLGERLFAAGALFQLEADARQVAFHAAGRAAQLDALLAIEADRLREPLAGLGDRDLELAREALAREIELEASSPDPAVRLGWVARLAPGAAGLAAPSPASVRALTPEDVRAWARSHLVPSRLVLVVAAPIGAEEIGLLIRSLEGARAQPSFEHG
jgi:zinc protease